MQHCQALKAFLVIVVYQRASQLRNRHFPCPCFNFIYLLLLFPATAWLMGQPGEGACLERLAQALSVGLVFQPPALWDAALFPFYGGGNRRLDLCHPGKSQGCGQGRLGGRCENGEGCGYQRLPGFTLEQEEWLRGPRAAVRGKKWGEGLRARQGVRSKSKLIFPPFYPK